MSQTEDRFAQTLSARRPIPAPGLPLQETSGRRALHPAEDNFGKSQMTLRLKLALQQRHRCPVLILLRTRCSCVNRLLRLTVPLTECRPHFRTLHTHHSLPQTAAT
eukprot:COSAG04_NODE_23112_length_343_cov_24.254098_1_plen_105_part_01